LLYISADGANLSSNNEQSTYNGWYEYNMNVCYFRKTYLIEKILGYNGGVATSSRKPVDKTDPSDRTHCLHPADLVPFTRKPLCLIIDSDNSTAFAVCYIYGIMYFYFT
jgi:hypothetical protein